MRYWELKEVILYKVTSTFRGRKNRFFFYLTKLNSNIQPNVFIKKFLKSLKAPELFWKTYFQRQVKKPGRCHNLGRKRVPWGTFCGNHS